MAKVRFAKFFSIDDGKAVKAQRRGWLNCINYMAPADSAGVGDLCPWRTKACTFACLGAWSGQAGMRKEGQDNATTRSRKAKAVYYMQERAAFMRETAGHIAKAIVRARAEYLKLCVRLNGSTDIAWESAVVDITPELAAELQALLGQCIIIGRVRLMDLFYDVQFDDYTKSVKRALRALTDPSWPKNYDLTFSRSESNWVDCLAVLEAGGRVAAVFSEPTERFAGYDVTDGDGDDLRHLDGPGLIGLVPKGRMAKRDVSGFVI